MSTDEQRKRNNKTLARIVIVFAVIAGITMYYGKITKQAKPNTAVKNVQIDGTWLPEAKSISDFSFTDNKGQAFTQSDLTGHWSFVFFGFTNCGYVCPTTMAELAKMYKTLEKELPAKEMPQIIMVSVDPARDSVERMNSYVTAFDPHFIGLRASAEKTLPVEKELHIVAVKMQQEQSTKDQYTINHSAEIMLFNPQGQLQAYLSFPHTAEQMVKDYKAVLAATHS